MLVALNGGPISSALMVVIMMGTVVGIIALVFSIVGLRADIKNGAPKYFGISGIVLSLLLPASFVLISMMSFLSNKSTHSQIGRPDTLDIHIAEAAVAAEDADADVTIKLQRHGYVRCLDNRNGENGVVGNMMTYELDFDSQVENWLKINDVKSSDNISRPKMPNFPIYER